jgi:hypothetical protein
VIGRYAKARPIGRMRPDDTVELDPAPEVRFEAGDRLVLVADDARRLELATVPLPALPPTGERGSATVEADIGDERLLVIGWNRLGAELLAYWHTFAPADATVEIAYDPRLVDEDEFDIPQMDMARVVKTPAAKVAELGDLAHREPRPTTVIVLAYSDRLSITDADSRTLLDLMVLQRRLAAGEGAPPRVVVELLDVDNLDLARVSGADDYLVSQAIGSQFIAQLAEQPERRAVYRQLYATGGPSIRLVSAERLGLVGAVSTSDIVATAYRAGVLAIGWRRSSARGGELTLNPHETEHVVLAADDEIVIVG